jgi:hypothetical protein
VEYALLNLQTSHILSKVGYQVNMKPPEITLQDGVLFRYILAIVDDQGATHFVEVERDVHKNLEQRQAKWRNSYKASGGKMFVVCDNRSNMRNMHSEINYILGGMKVMIGLTNLADLKAGKRGEGDRVGLKRVTVSSADCKKSSVANTQAQQSKVGTEVRKRRKAMYLYGFGRKA